MSLPNSTYIDSYIRDGKAAVISLKNLYDTILVGDTDNPTDIFRIPYKDFFIKYKIELSTIVQIYSCPESMFYRPKTMSLELYGTTELWLGLLRLNGMKNITEFHSPVIYVYSPDGIKELINIFFKREEKIT